MRTKADVVFAWLIGYATGAAMGAIVAVVVYGC
jgi:hypothetical protein